MLKSDFAAGTGCHQNESEDLDHCFCSPPRVKGIWFSLFQLVEFSADVYLMVVAVVFFPERTQ